MRIQILSFGKLKTPGLREAADHYLKMIRPWVQVQETELKPIAVMDGSDATRSQVQRKETEILLQKISPKSGPSKSLQRIAFYVLDETGKAKPTLEWAKMIQSWESEGLSEVSLCIGSSIGFSDEFRKQARGILGLGPQTLSHELARVILMEQLYRAYSVNRGHPYHVEG